MASNTVSTRERVLVIFPGALGDLMCLLPALKVLARRYHGRDLELMARAELANFAVGRMGIARAHSIDRREVSLLFSPADNAAAEAREFFGIFSRVHSFFGHDDARLRQTLPQACGGEVFFHPFRPAAGGHVAAAYVESLGEPRGDGGLRSVAGAINLSAEDLAQAGQLLESRGVEAGSFILLMPGSGSRTKNWPAEGYLELARRLGESIPTITVLGPAEEHLDSLFSGLRPVKSPSLGTLAGLARLSRAFVGNDSGTSHLAAAAGGHGVVIFGPTDPERWRPLGRVIVLQRIQLQDLRWQEVAQALTGLRERAESDRQLC
ncbi:MAG: glycosyltransferase family 9 protein [Candidatus Binataceae bacterium]